MTITCPTCETTARGNCPHATTCPQCQAGPHRPCKRPSGHPCGIHTGRYRASEQADARLCPGFEPSETEAGTGCAHCSGLPEDHEQHQAEENRPAATASARPSQGAFDFGPSDDGPYTPEPTPPEKDPRGRKQRPWIVKRPPTVGPRYYRGGRRYEQSGPDAMTRADEWTEDETQALYHGTRDQAQHRADLEGNGAYITQL
jgi:hypothetical protein